MVPTTIDDPDDPRVADYRRLNDAAHRRAVEAPGPFHRGLFVVEGWLPVGRLVGSRFPLRSILVDEARINRLGGLIRLGETPVYVANRPVLDDIVGFPLHRGIVAVAERGLALLPEVVAGRGRCLTVVEGVNDAENLGSIVRNAATLGGDGLLLDPTTCDPLSRRTVRVSVGHILSMPFARAPWPDMLTDLSESGVTTVALTPRAGADDIAEIELGGHARVAIVVGAEGDGLTDATIDACARAVRIPMVRGADSLNVAAATAVAAHRLFAHNVR